MTTLRFSNLVVTVLQVAHKRLVAILYQVLHDLQALDLAERTLLAKPRQQVILQVGAQLNRLKGQLADFVIVVACRGLGLVGGGLVEQGQLPTATFVRPRWRIREQ